MIDLNDLTLGQLKEIQQLAGCATKLPESKTFPYVLGEPYFIRTVTFIYTGRLVAVTDQELVLEDVAWIADTGRFADALKDLKKLNEIEPFPDGQVILGRGAIVDAHISKGSALPRSQK